jgi:hypothetical protein
VPKRLRYFLQADPAVQNLALHIFLSAVEHGLRAACPAAQDSPIPTARIGAVAFSGKLIPRPSQRRTTNSTSASPGRDGNDKGWGLSRDDSCMKVQDRPNAAGLEPSCNGSAWESDVSERNSRLTCGEKRGDTYRGVVEFPILRPANCSGPGRRWSARRTGAGCTAST